LKVDCGLHPVLEFVSRKEVSKSNFDSVALLEAHARDRRQDRLTTLKGRENTMTRIFVLAIVMVLALFSSVAVADNNGEAKAGRLFLFQKCDDSLKDTQGHDSFGCPNIGTGPWPIFPGNNRWGELDYRLWGDTFKFSFSGRGLLPGTNYTLIYYPDPWPGAGLICLGSGQSTPLKGKGKGKLGDPGKGKGGPSSGNIAIHGNVDVGDEGLPISTDANAKPAGSSGAVGAKIWLVQSEDVQCTKGASMMLKWNPAAYLFEYNLVVFEHRAAVPDDDDDDD
jgi:hypothetical protein